MTSSPGTAPSTGKDRRKRRRAFPKGRQPDEAAHQRIVCLIGEGPHPRDLLIEYLHLIQDKYGCLGAAHLAALAHELKLAMAEVYEVASFYHHFDIVKEHEAAPAPVTVRVCDSLSCMMAGGETLFHDLQSKLPSQDVRVVHAPCMGRCQCAPVAVVGQNHIDHATVQKIEKAAKNKELVPILPAYSAFYQYKQNKGYEQLSRCRNGELSVSDVVETLSNAGLRGLGGAGFGSGQKWKFVLAERGPRYLAVNADEGEPGTFKDRHYLESDPHRFLEGALIAAWAIEAQAVYIYLRDEYPAVREILTREIAALQTGGVIPPDFIHLRRGAGSYVCGEESAMLESIEGKRGLPRHRPPYAAQVGLFGRPTLVHNVETLTWIPSILEKGSAWFVAQGKPDHPGLRSYSVSGRVKEPGVKLCPAGTTARELIEAYAGGMADGHTFKAYLPGGASGGILPASLADEPLDFGTLEPLGAFVGSHAVVILSDKDNMRDVVLNLMRFFEDESCGQCTPCRVGTEKAVALLERDTWNEGLLEELNEAMADASICGLGQAAPNPIRSALKYFRDDLALSAGAP